MRTKLTDAAIRSYEPRPAPYTVGDAACPGLCIRITPKGVKTFAFAYRNKATGKVEWLTLGRYPDVPLTRARGRERCAQDRSQWRHAARAQVRARRDGTKGGPRVRDRDQSRWDARLPLDTREWVVSEFSLHGLHESRAALANPEA